MKQHAARFRVSGAGCSIFRSAENYDILHLSKPKYAYLRAVGPEAMVCLISAYREDL